MAVRTVPTLVTAPATEPVTLTEVKSWLKIDSSDDDTLLGTLIQAAREAAEKYTGRAFITQTWKVTLDLAPSTLANNLPDGNYDLPSSILFGGLPNEIDLPYKPIQSITSVVTYDTANASSTYSASSYFCDTASGRLVLNYDAVWPTSLRSRASCVVTYVAGYGLAASVPQTIKTAILMHIQKMYDDRIMCDLPPTCEDLLLRYKVYYGLQR